MGVRECLSGGTPEMMQEWLAACDEVESAKVAWVKRLRKEGFTASRPNDGWVDRDNMVVTMFYPQFDDGVSVGDSVMLGWPGDRWNRPIVLTEKIGAGVPQSFAFRDKEGR